MAFTAPAPEAIKREPIPAGLVAARCYMLVDLGKQNDSWQGEAKIIHKIRLAFEIPKYRFKYTDSDGKEQEGPSVIGDKFTLSMGEKANLRKLIEEWFGKKFPSNEAAAQFDLEKVVGHVCMINVVHTEKNGNTYANIGSLSPYMQEMGPPPAPELDPIIYTDGNADVFEKLPDWIKKIISEQVLDKPLPQQQAHAQSDPGPMFDAPEMPPGPSSFDDSDLPF